MKTIIQISVLLILMLSVVNCSKDDATSIAPETPVATLASISPTNGPKTTIVTIHGNNFGADPSKVEVYFNEKEADIQSVENTKIITTVPVRAYTGTVKVVVDGTELIGPKFTYIITDVLVSTFTGSTNGDTDGALANAKFSFPTDGVFDSQGNLFVVDKGSHRIRKITPSGTVSTFAGSDNGNVDGSGTNAQFDFPYGIAIDAQDNLYVADYHNYKVRKITPSGVVSTFAGSEYGNEDGTGVNAKFKHPFGIVVDSQNNIYVSDYANHNVRKITPEGVVTTLAGSGVAGDVDGNGTSAQFRYPYGLTIDAEDNIYIADAYNHKIKKITLNGEVSTVAGSAEGYADGSLLTSKFNVPVGITISEDGILYVVDYFNQRIRKISANGIVSTLAGQSTVGDTNGTGANAQFRYPYGICMDAEGDLYVMDSGNSRIRKITQE